MELLTEIKENLNFIGVRDVNYKGVFKEDMTEIFNCICDKYDVGCESKICLRNYLMNYLKVKIVQHILEISILFKFS